MTLKISYISTYNALDIHNWSGLGYFIAHSLMKQNAQLDFIGNLQASPSMLLKLKKKYYQRIGRDFFYEREKSFVQQYAKQASGKIRPDTDILFSPGSLAMACLKSSKTKATYSDCTFAAMINFYPDFYNLSEETIKHGNSLEKESLEGTDILFYASDWAASSAIEFYGIPPAKVNVVPFGANIEHSYKLHDIKKFVAERSKTDCQILFSGVEWFRKGGDKAIDVVRELNESGLKTTLHLLGIDRLPIDYELPEYVINHGFISKSHPGSLKKITDLLIKSHFLILPTIAEAYGLVLCEANSFGIPCITTSVGGIPTIIKDDINGKCFDLGDTAFDYARYIKLVFDSKSLYEQMAFESFNEYEKRLNWTVAGASIMKTLREAK